jgi:hypothetical protein
MRWSAGLMFLVVECSAGAAWAQLPVSPEPVAPSPQPPAIASEPPAATPAAASEPPATDLDVTVPPPPAAKPPASEPPPPPPPDTDGRVPRERRPFYIAGELGWNGLSGLGVNFGYHPEPHFAIDTGAGLSLTGLRIGARLRLNFLTGEWTPFLGAGFSFAGGSGGTAGDFESQGEKAKAKILASPFVQLAGGVNYTGREGFLFTATSGYSILTRKGGNTRFVSGSQQAYDDIKPIFGGGVILSVAFGYAF